jgi:hypothetical protein
MRYLKTAALSASIALAVSAVLPYSFAPTRPEVGPTAEEVDAAVRYAASDAVPNAGTPR